MGAKGDSLQVLWNGMKTKWPLGKTTTHLWFGSEPSKQVHLQSLKTTQNLWKGNNAVENKKPLRSLSKPCYVNLHQAIRSTGHWTILNPSHGSPLFDLSSPLMRRFGLSCKSARSLFHADLYANTNSTSLHGFWCILMLRLVEMVGILSRNAVLVLWCSGTPVNDSASSLSQAKWLKTKK